MKGLTRFLRDTWWVFLGAAVLVIVMANLTGWVIYYGLLPVLCLMAYYMAAVRYDHEGNERYPQPKPTRWKLNEPPKNSTEPRQSADKAAQQQQQQQ